MNKIKIIFQVLFLVCSFISCQNYESMDLTDFDGNNKYDGTVWDYLQEGETNLELRFDSLKHVISANADLQTLLDDENARLTLFAIPDECFTSVLNTLNMYREKNNLGAPLTLDSLLTKDEIIIHDTIVSGINNRDTIFNDRIYNYPKEMRELACRYLFDTMYDTNTIEADGGEIIAESYDYSYNMGITASRHAAEGAVASGIRFMVFSDCNNSQLTSRWTQSDVVCFDIRAKNGIVHVLSTGHEFGFDEFVTRFNNFGNEYETTE